MSRIPVGSLAVVWALLFVSTAAASFGYNWPNLPYGVNGEFEQQPEPSLDRRRLGIDVHLRI